MQIPPFPVKGNSPRCSGRKSWGHLTCQRIPRFPPSRFTCAHPLLTTACHSAAVPAAVVSAWVPDGTTQRASRFSLPEHGSHRDLVIAAVGSCRSSVRWPAGPDACWPPACCLFDLFSPRLCPPQVPGTRASGPLYVLFALSDPLSPADVHMLHPLTNCDSWLKCHLLGEAFSADHVRL